MTKTQILAAYLDNLETIYSGRVDYSIGSKSREMATRAANAALAGQIRLEGEAWFRALSLAGLGKLSTRAQIAAIPD